MSDRFLKGSATGEARQREAEAAAAEAAEAAAAAISGTQFAKCSSEVNINK